MHPLDTAIALTSAAPGQFSGQTSPAYWNMVGPFGGCTAAQLLQAVLQHPDCQGEPVSLTVHFAAAQQDGPFTIQATPARTNRSTQHWILALLQPGADGQPQLVTTAMAVTAQRRKTWSASDQPMPRVAPPSAYAQAQVAGDFKPPWFSRYEMRPIEGAIPQKWDGADHGSLTQLWLRDAPARALDFPALAAMADVFFPRVWLRRARLVPAGTVALTVYFHADSALLAATGKGHVLAQARGQGYRNGFFDHNAQLWSEAGDLLATSHQVVYFKE